MLSKRFFKVGVGLVAVVFSVIFCTVVIPPLIKDPDILFALGQGFVNPYASGYSADVICCWLVLCIWVIYESPKVKNGWVCLILGLVPGVAVGFAGYLILRANQLK